MKITDQNKVKTGAALCVGLVAHVDAGKTTLSEAMLYESGTLRKLGRVDHQDAFLDHNAQERERGITIFSKQARLTLPSMDMVLMDTPGHVDFSSEMERTLQVLDYAILVISGTDRVQSHTRTVWKLLEKYEVPTFIFVNKMDLAGIEASLVQEELQQNLSEGCIDFTHGYLSGAWQEAVAMCSEEALAAYLETDTVPDETVAALIQSRKLFPCFYGSALKLEGVDSFLKGMERYMRPSLYPQTWGAKVYKIVHTDGSQKERLTYLKITGGELKVKDSIGEEKIDQIRLYSGAKYQLVDKAQAGMVCAVTGLEQTYPGQGLGAEPDSDRPLLGSFLTYQLILPENKEPHTVLPLLRQLEEEDPQLHIVWNEALREIHVQLMGEVQLEVLSRLIQDRFHLAVRFGPGHIVYRETITAPVVGMGHFEPLRHYAEVHLLLEPGERGSGLQIESRCSEDKLEKNWQRLIVTHLQERAFPGVLTGSEITDMKISLVAGRAHVKHTEGGDFRQATYRALRQGLLKAQSLLLEPWYEFELEVPAAQTGRAMADLQRMAARIESQNNAPQRTILRGKAPVSELQGYALEVTAYTRGEGHLSCMPAGYAPCHNAQAVIEAIRYEPEKDLDNTGDSVFCAHGAGFVVKWNEADAYMHVENTWLVERPRAKREKDERLDAQSLDEELMKIYERTYGPIRRRDIRPNEVNRRREKQLDSFEPVVDYLLIDGYNVIHAWEEFQEIAAGGSGGNMDAARQMLLDLLCAYQSYKKCVCIVVFDAYRTSRGVAEVEQYHNISVVYTKQAETADTYIERATYELGKKHRVMVVTSDGAEQMIVLGHGALRLSAREFKDEIRKGKDWLEATLKRWNSEEGEKLSQSLFAPPRK